MIEWNIVNTYLLAASTSSIVLILLWFLVIRK